MSWDVTRALSGALVLTGNREAAEDLVQKTLEKACRKWRTNAAKDAPDAYGRRITVHGLPAARLSKRNR
ncbi:sigma factor [Streptomyces sp. NY05-11A]|uniref:sigma factor n=1 Tax=Streptomyces soliscabiei TaxID=588897 RepID=UPI0029A0499D|nr:sigma factor [Streptomyces sp. NY05-11A]MDX2675418.1 sigma factor [Streptomyces sp. NY05-11A]